MLPVSFITFDCTCKWWTILHSTYCNKVIDVLESLCNGLFQLIGIHLCRGSQLRPMGGFLSKINLTVPSKYILKGRRTNSVLGVHGSDRGAHCLGVIFSFWSVCVCVCVGGCGWGPPELSLSPLPHFLVLPTPLKRG